MTSQIDPIDVSAMISDSYRRYLRSLLPVRDPALARALAEQINESELLSKGPLLEATPAYETGRTPRELIAEGVLSSGFDSLTGPAVHLDRPLYTHQEEAIRKARQKRNLVVATGTGSGKTESFLLPVLNELQEEHERGELGPGVRAILLYPMNALANDQLKRLRESLLAHSPHITFGRYTGETKETEQQALDSFKALHPALKPLPNEYLSRERMRREPPHLLLTNYAMLEYLLLRPADLDLFEGEHAGHWRFIALDEAHVYDGAKAAELAMLLRRLRDRVAPGQNLQCIATSATVGDDPGAVTSFAERLFDAPFTWDDGDPERQDLIRATHRDTVPDLTWGPLSALDYRALREEDDPGRALRAAASRHGANSPDPFALLAGEQRLQHLRVLLARGGPRPLSELAEELFAAVPDTTGPAGHLTAEDRLRALADLVSLASAIRDDDGNPLLSARYHLFTRATDGAFTCLTDQGPHVSLARHEHCATCAASAFEIGACKRCGDLYLVGSITVDGSKSRLLPQSPHQKAPDWLHLGNTPITLDDDDDTLEIAPKVTPQSRYLCAGCGTLTDSPTGACAVSCERRSLREVRLIRTRGDKAARCLNCGALGRHTLRRFESGNEASAAVVATALYQALPEDTDDKVADQPGGGRKLLMFNDSRQSAAFFAPYLETSYRLFQRRRLILDGMRDIHDPEDELRVDDLVDATARTARNAGQFDRKVSKRRRAATVAPWVMSELVSTNDRQSLEGRGLLRVGLTRPEGALLPKAFSEQLGLAEDEVWDLFGELVRTLRQQGALTMLEDVAPDDEAFAPRLGPVYVRLTGSDRARKVISWLPTSGQNSRLNYLRRLFERLGLTDNPDLPPLVLKKVWELLRGTRDGWLVPSEVRLLGTVFQVDHESLELSLVTPESSPYQCDGCRRLHPVSVRGVCPTMNCPGTLRPYDIPDPDKDSDHYRHLYRTLNPVPLSAQEHTAQWSSTEAARIQQEFVKGRVNALSCSTTFELGVDVGELQSVFMRNMPPTTANYVQRAGRAGRRADSAALVVTYAQRRSHDLFRYQEPEKMIAGEVRAPYVPLANVRIDRRHAHSVALAAFFRYWFQETGESWTRVGQFFLPSEAGPAPVQRVAAFLSPVPTAVTEALFRILPPEITKAIDVAGGTWAGELTELLESLRLEVDQDVADFERRRVEAFEARRDGLAERFGKTIRTVVERSLIGFLATRNVLPKYGFPVDTVELRTHHSGEPVGGQLELARDRSSAIYEYAPGGSIIAGGRKWTSAGIYRLPGRELHPHHYRVCAECGFYAESKDPLAGVCGSCGALAQGGRTKYIIPEFGFVADTSVQPAGTSPPQRSWHGFTSVLRLAADPEDHCWPLPGGGEVLCRAGSRGELVAISDGPSGQGYRICGWCGWGRGTATGKMPDEHTNPMKGTPCTGPLSHLSLAHRYETDIVEISFGGRLDVGRTSDPVRYSLLYSLLEGASSALDISRDDIDGATFRRAAGTMALVLFDTVPGGAGGATRTASAFPQVLEAAHARVASCDCGVETSCYGCLRNYRNQHFHDRLRRDAAIGALEALL
ncbi:DEAD/DEAH box helicase [Nocardiopsis alba]|uniref:Helicase conserved C-terminal domain protein n=1 Tax=Nocardiopsis alba (strain ATCC BAA-2165 / BE74) TaxID=1205910 RepID=J7L1A3_NOCAA|nr:DEAD/DEAH box helicase [Nocardiopsis alba]AFR06526.1 helicase conserved C-terminal domain protein [Nocardiopsis alba ATCC BAA-2165]